jgi:hypothetical protein
MAYLLSSQMSKRTDENVQARNDGNVRVILPFVPVPINQHSDVTREMQAGDYVVVRIDDANTQTLIGIPLYHSSITEYSSNT